MKHYNTIGTSKEKAAFIADNMQINFVQVDDDGEISFECKFDQTIYTVHDDMDNVICFEFYNEAVEYFDKLAKNLEDLDIISLGIGSGEVILSKNRIHFRRILQGIIIDVATLSDIFDEFLYDDSETIIAHI